MICHLGLLPLPRECDSSVPRVSSTVVCACVTARALRFVQWRARCFCAVVLVALVRVLYLCSIRAFLTRAPVWMTDRASDHKRDNDLFSSGQRCCADSASPSSAMSTVPATGGDRAGIQQRPTHL